MAQATGFVAQVRELDDQALRHPSNQFREERAIEVRRIAMLRERHGMQAIDDVDGRFIELAACDACGR